MQSASSSRTALLRTTCISKLYVLLPADTADSAAPFFKSIDPLLPCSQAIYKSYLPDGTMTLQHFIIIFGAVQLILSQLPNIHSLRGLNLLSTLATLSFATIATGMSIAGGREIDRSTVSYTLEGDSELVLMSAFAALGTIAFRYVWIDRPSGCLELLLFILYV